MKKRLSVIAATLLLAIFSFQEIASAALWWGAAARRAAKKIEEMEDGDSKKSETSEPGETLDQDEAKSEGFRPLKRLREGIESKLSGSGE
ncbi:MAG TPA: hypothetical protein PKL97_08755 [Candidatus Omnitrophota bacterium]|nr:hypothetical protein [Candidatus Omnitrophota bacterium]